MRCVAIKSKFLLNIPNDKNMNAKIDLVSHMENN